MSRRLGLACLVLFGCSAEVQGLAGNTAAIVAGTPITGESAVVAVVRRRLSCGETPSTVLCSGTLVAPRVVLTAAHCVLDEAPRGSLEVFFGDELGADGAYVVVLRQTVHPDFDDETSRDDLALLLLAADAPVESLPLPTVSVDDLPMGSPLRAVGFGQTGRTVRDSGTKREGILTLSEVRGGAFDATANPSMTCVGDSGGPVFADIDGVAQLVGVTSRGDFSCMDFALNMRVDVAVDTFIAPFLLEAEMALEAWPASPALEELASFACSDDEGCPAAMRCSSNLEGASHCEVPGLGAGSFGETCAAATDCGAETPCALVWPGEAGGCRCFTADFVPGPVPPGGGGCAVSHDDGNEGAALGLGLALLLFARRRLEA